MSHMHRIAHIALALCLTGSLPAAAQTLSRPEPECGDTAAMIAAYHRCALWVDGHRVRRGAGGEVVARPGFFRPAPLTRVVYGDSARAHAARYERSTARATTLSFVSGLLFGAAWVVALSYDCDRGPFGPCTNTDDAHGVASGVLAIGSGIALLASVPFSIQAARARARAIWWNNARFAR
jgi:hypothetical protein